MVGARTCEHVSVALMTSAAVAAATDQPDGFMKGKYIHPATSSSISRFSPRKEIFFPYSQRTRRDMYIYSEAPHQRSQVIRVNSFMNDHREHYLSKGERARSVKSLVRRSLSPHKSTLI